MRDVAIVGVSMLKFGRYPDKQVPELGAQAVLLALNDAGITLKDVEIMVSGNLYQSNATVGQRILKEIGQTGIPVVNVANACATGSTPSMLQRTLTPSGRSTIAATYGTGTPGAD